MRKQMTELDILTAFLERFEKYLNFDDYGSVQKFYRMLKKYSRELARSRSPNLILNKEEFIELFKDLFVDEMKEFHKVDSILLDEKGFMGMMSKMYKQLNKEGNEITMEVHSGNFVSMLNKAWKEYKND